MQRVKQNNIQRRCAMTLKELTQKLNAEYFGDKDVEISGIAYDSRKVKPGYLFVAIKGFETDGHKYIESAVSNGAVAVVGEDDHRLCLRTYGTGQINTLLIRAVYASPFQFRESPELVRKYFCIRKAVGHASEAVSRMQTAPRSVIYEFHLYPPIG